MRPSWTKIFFPNSDSGSGLNKTQLDRQTRVVRFLKGLSVDPEADYRPRA